MFYYFNKIFIIFNENFKLKFSLIISIDFTSYIYNFKIF